jgi:putative transposase
MKKIRFYEEQIIKVLKEHDASAKESDLCRRNGMSLVIFYKWKLKFGSLKSFSFKRQLVYAPNLFDFLGSFLLLP